MTMTLVHPRHPRPLGAVILAAALSLALTGCGASRPPAPPTHAAVTTAAATPAPPPAPAVTGGRLISTGALRATLSGQNHAPKVNHPWRYSVTVSNAAGQPLSGTVAIEFLFSGQIVAHDKPPTHPLANGLWQSSLKMPVASAGYPLVLRAIAHTSAGSITLNWPITVKR
jgi:hypothetical protein